MFAFQFLSISQRLLLLLKTPKYKISIKIDTVIKLENRQDRDDRAKIL
jgi:hypothetical protein